MADKEIADHAKIEEILEDLEHREAGGERFDAFIEQLIAQVSGHVEDEEDRLLPALRPACTSEKLDELGQRALSARKTASARPPANKLHDQI